MATYLTRIVEVRDASDNNNWHLVNWYNPKGKIHGCEVVDPKYPELVTRSGFTNNAVCFRDMLRNSAYADRGFPNDMSVETKEALITEHDDSLKWAYGKTYLTLEELDMWFERLKGKLIHNILESYDKLKYKEINEKLDCLLTNTAYLTMTPEDGEEDDEDNEYYNNHSDLDYYINEVAEDVMSVSDELNAISFIMRELGGNCGMHLHENVRVIYYYA